MSTFIPIFYFLKDRIVDEYDIIHVIIALVMLILSSSELLLIIRSKLPAFISNSNQPNDPHECTMIALKSLRLAQNVCQLLLIREALGHLLTGNSH